MVAFGLATSAVQAVKVCVPLIKTLVTQVTLLQLSYSDTFKHVSVACYSTSTKLRLCSDVTLNAM
jgi:hypothetical protein